MEFPAHLSSLQDEGRHRGQSMAYNELFLALDEPSEETKTTTTQRPRTFSKARQHICIVHGYILAGTGSNIYSTNVGLICSLTLTQPYWTRTDFSISYSIILFNVIFFIVILFIIFFIVIFFIIIFFIAIG